MTDQPTITETPPDVPPAPAVGAEVVRFQGRNSLAAKVHYARELAQSGLLPAVYRGKPSNMLWAVEFGEMLGLSPMAAVTGVHVIEGKPTASAALISALVRRAGHRLRVTGNDTRAVAQIVRADDPDFTFESVWTLDRAKQAGLVGKDVWKKYPAAMLKARAITEAARDACEEALCGMHYTAEELGAAVDEDGNPTTVVERDWNAEIAGCGSDLTKLGALWKQAHALGLDDVKRQINTAAQKVKAAQEQPLTTGPSPAVSKPDEEVVIVEAELVDDEPMTPLAVALERLTRAIAENRWDRDKVEDLFAAQYQAELAETTNADVVDRFRESLFAQSDAELRAAS